MTTTLQEIEVNWFSFLFMSSVFVVGLEKSALFLVWSAHISPTMAASAEASPEESIMFYLGISAPNYEYYISRWRVVFVILLIELFYLCCMSGVTAEFTLWLRLLFMDRLHQSLHGLTLLIFNSGFHGPLMHSIAPPLCISIHSAVSLWCPSSSE